MLRARRKPEALNRASPCPSAWTACGFASQAFGSGISGGGVSVFNADIGAWNTARVIDLSGVCAAPGPAARTMAGRARPGFGAVRPVVRGGTADARARVRTRVGTRLRGALGAGMAARRGGSMYASEYICTYMCACVCYTFVHTLSIYLYM